MRVLVLGNAGRPGVPEAAERLLPFLGEHCEIVAVDLRQELDLSQISADLCLVLGGDGAILRAARQMGYHQTPVLGINLGKLGFLADLSPEEMCCCFPAVARGEFRVTHHLMFECLIDGTGEQPLFLGLNEVAIQAGPPFHTIDLDLIIDDEPVSRYSCDGLIVSTPIGSTAHNLSAGGPILGQGLSAFVITPICPHTLTNRPIVIPDSVTIEIGFESGETSAFLTLDGQVGIELSQGDRVVLRKAPNRLRLVRPSKKTYYQILRSKLKWGER
jgi:NAD+ kinase